MAEIKKQVSVFLDLPRWKQLRQAAARQRKAMSQVVIDEIDWKRVAEMAEADAPERDDDSTG